MTESTYRSDPFWGIPNSDDAERRQFDAPAEAAPAEAAPVTETTTQLAYETAVARFCAIADTYEDLIGQLRAMQAAVEAEYDQAGKMLRDQERKPGVHKPFTTAELDLDDLDMLETEAQLNLAKRIPWASWPAGWAGL